MNQKTLAKWLKFIIIGIGVCGLVIYFLLLPHFGMDLVEENPDLSHCFYPWLIFLWLTAVPCYVVLVLGWRIFGNIGRDNSFCEENSRLLKWVSILAAADSAFFFIMNVVYFFLGMNHPSVLLASLIITFIGAAITVAAAALSHLVLKAAGLQEQSDLTI